MGYEVPSKAPPIHLKFKKKRNEMNYVHALFFKNYCLWHMQKITCKSDQVQEEFTS